jgi:hypothetical protein
VKVKMNRRVSVPVTGEFHQDINAVIAGMVERQQRTTVNPPWKGAECLFENITRLFLLDEAATLTTNWCFV